MSLNVFFRKKYIAKNVIVVKSLIEPYLETKKDHGKLIPSSRHDE